MSHDFVEDTTTSKRIARDKARVLIELENNPIVSAVVRKVGVSHSTYYRWLKEDSDFEAKAIQASDIGRRRMVDLAISQLLKMVQEGNVRAITYYLSHNDDRYRNGITLTESQLKELLFSHDYAPEVLRGNIPAKVANSLNSLDKLDLARRRTNITEKALGGGSL